MAQVSPRAATAPGELLYEFLCRRYPHKQGEGETPGWLSAICADFDCPELEHLLYDSTVLMKLRRLISAAQWYRGQFAGDALERFQEDYLRYRLSFNRDEARMLAVQVIRAAEAADGEIERDARVALIERARAKQWPCGLCGSQIDYTDDKAPNYVSLDHVWPRSLGGTSDLSNLRITCRSCNEARQSTVSAGDCHFEHCHTSLDETHRSFTKEFNRAFRLAVSLRDRSSCSQCNRPAHLSRSGKFTFSRKSNDEPHHFFNTTFVCRECK